MSSASRASLFFLTLSSLKSPSLRAILLLCGLFGLAGCDQFLPQSSKPPGETTTESEVPADESETADAMTPENLEGGLVPESPPLPVIKPLFSVVRLRSLRDIIPTFGRPLTAVETANKHGEHFSWKLETGEKVELTTFDTKIAALKLEFVDPKPTDSYTALGLIDLTPELLNRLTDSGGIRGGSSSTSAAPAEGTPAAEPVAFIENFNGAVDGVKFHRIKVERDGGETAAIDRIQIDFLWFKEYNTHARVLTELPRTSKLKIPTDEEMAKQAVRTEKLAEERLQLAKKTRANGHRSAYLNRLKEIITKYPDSAAAKEAQELLAAPADK